MTKVVTFVSAALFAFLGLAVIDVGPASASEERPTLQEIEGEVYCPTCKQLLSLSSAPVAERMRQFISERIAAGDTKSAIKAQLVDEFGEAVLAAPTTEGFNVLAWVLPLVGAAVAIVVIAFAIRRWTAGKAIVPATVPSRNGRSGLDPELERRVDEELDRYDGP